MADRRTPAERFTEFVDTAGPLSLIRGVHGPCHQWTGSADDSGYARFWLNGRNRRAYHLAYIAAHGPIPTGHEVDHHCRNRRCVNPGHLRALTHRDNVLTSSNIAAYRAAQTRCHKGHPFDEANTARRPNGTRQCRTCANARKAAARAAQRAKSATVHHLTPHTTTIRKAA
ncbi:HNH endonuclease signature motif containing protein [Streptomyces sp. NPDC048404]|uniref:HNH endonuclease signature motif containing protein n=1 Tax=unclassified Streptomyces TaxID=2593676 RepID=UPI003439C3B9